MFLGERFDPNQIGLRAAGDGARRDHAQAAALHVALQKNADGGEITGYFIGIRIETDEERAFAPLAGGLGKRPAQRRLGGARESRDQDARAPIIATAQHGIQAIYPARDTLAADFGAVTDQGARDSDVETVLADEKGRLIFVVRRAAIFLHTQIAL